MLVLIFVTVGSRPYQFDRLFKELDALVEKKVIKEEIFAQIGSSSYQPLHYEYKDYISPDEFNEYIKKADIVVSHGASGSIVKALKKRKKVLGVTRLAKYGEHIDDHQIQMNQAFEEAGYIIAVYDIKKLEDGYLNIQSDTLILKEWENDSNRIIDLIDEFILENWK